MIVLLDVYEETLTGTTKGAGVEAAPIADPPLHCKLFFILLDYRRFVHVYNVCKIRVTLNEASP
ncbi:MAG: hypothetical protein JW781_02100 [Deltaproteobacteria bacterium]|nr:hypothetical protein [Candidatus Anaeroferrophillacea bacterium]